MVLIQYNIKSVEDDAEKESSQERTIIGDITVDNDEEQSLEDPDIGVEKTNYERDNDENMPLHGVLQLVGNFNFFLPV